MGKEANLRKTHQGRKARESGYNFEKLVCAFLFLKGYNIVARNFKIGRGIGCGEVDIIAVKDKTLVFFEVKSRKTLDLAADAITLRNKQRVTKSAKLFLATHPQYRDYDVRFDAVLRGFGGIPRHIRDAWRPDWW